MKNKNYFYEMIPADEMARLQYLPTIPQFLEKLKNEYAALPAVSDMTTTYTYAEFYERIGRRRKLINGLGLKKGAKIAVWDRNSVDAMELYLAITSAGYVTVMLPATLQEMQMLGSLKKFDVEAMFVREEFRPMCEKVQVKMLSTKEIADTFTPSAEVRKEDLASIFFTGGTTGMPKGVMLSHGNMMRGAFNGMFMPSSVIGNQRYIAFLPFSHIFGIVRGLLACFFTGSLVYSCEDMKAGIGTLPRIKPTCLVLVPGLCEILLGLTKMYGPQFLGGELKLIIAGAANVPPVLIKAFKELNIRLLGGYGLTESSNLVSGNANVEEYPESVGPAYPEQEYKFVNGELWIKGDHVMMGYYNDPEATAATMEDGWLKTGDLVHEDENGYLYIDGRIKNIIVLKNGENVLPESIEEKFYMNRFVRDCLVKPTSINGDEVIGIEILPRMEMFKDATPEMIQKTLQGVVDEINKELPPFARIITMKVRTEDFKRTGSLKVDRRNS